MEKLTCKQFVETCNLDSTWRKGDKTKVNLSAEEILKSPLFFKQAENIWIDENGNAVEIIDIENIYIKYETIVE